MALHINTQPQLVIGHGAGLKLAALAGCGIAQLPSWLVEQHLQDGTLVQVLPHLACVGMGISVAWVKHCHALPKVRAVVEVLVAGLGAVE